MAEEFILRRAQQKDYPGIHALFWELHRQHVQGRPDIYREADPLPPEEYQRLLQSQDALLLAAFDGEQTAGVCQLSVRRPESPLLRPQTSAFIEALAVGETYRRQGVGSLLLCRAREAARERGAVRLQLNVWCFNEAAIAFYRRMGFRDQRIGMEEWL